MPWRAVGRMIMRLDPIIVARSSTANLEPTWWSASLIFIIGTIVLTLFLISLLINCACCSGSTRHTKEGQQPAQLSAVPSTQRMPPPANITVAGMDPRYKTIRDLDSFCATSKRAKPKSPPHPPKKEEREDRPSPPPVVADLDRNADQQKQSRKPEQDQPINRGEPPSRDEHRRRRDKDPRSDQDLRLEVRKPSPPHKDHPKPPTPGQHGSSDRDQQRAASTKSPKHPSVSQAGRAGGHGHKATGERGTPRTDGHHRRRTHASPGHTKSPGSRPSESQADRATAMAEQRKKDRQWRRQYRKLTGRDEQHRSNTAQQESPRQIPPPVASAVDQQQDGNKRRTSGDDPLTLMIARRTLIASNAINNNNNNVAPVNFPSASASSSKGSSVDDNQQPQADQPPRAGKRPDGGGMTNTNVQRPAAKAPEPSADTRSRIL